VSRRAPLRVAATLFFVSGATGLAYETIWFKRFGQVWGSSAMSLASVVACFLLGLGIGAWLGGRIADRSGRPLILYAFCEAAIGVLALLVPLELNWLNGIAAELYPTIQGQPLLGMGVRVLATLVVLLPPSILMGATLPLLVRVFALAGRPLGKSAALLYASNSLGAATGVWLAGFHLLPGLGIGWTNGIVAAVNLALGVLAAVFGSRWRPDIPGPAPVPATAPPSSFRATLAAFASGIGALLLQMVWARQLVVLLGGSTYAYSALLAVFVAGLGGGSLIFRLLAPRDARRLGPWMTAAVAVLVAWTLIGFQLAPELGEWVGSRRGERASAATNAFICAATAAALQGIPTLAMGFIFPGIVQLAAHLRRSGAEASARTVGRIYAWNTAGSILAAFATAPFLLPHLGSAWIIALALGAYLVLPLLLGSDRRRSRMITTAACGAGLAAVIGVTVFANPDPRLTNLGLYLYGPEAYPDPLEQTTVLAFVEGPTSNVLVLEEWPGPHITIRVNGKVDGGTGGDMKTQLGLAWVPRFLRPAAKDVLVIGFGTGTTAGASLLFPETRVDCLEIEPAMVAASPFFHAINYAPELSERFHFIPGDARAHVLGAEQRYDMIISEPSNPWIAGVSNLFTREFFLAARGRLKPDGILAQWIQTYSLSGDEFALIIRTVRSVFRDCVIFRLASGDTVLVASATRVLPPAETLALSQELIDGGEEIRAGLEQFFGTTDVRALLLGLVLLDVQGLQRLLQDNPGEVLNTDFNLRLEFDSPQHTFQEDWGTDERPVDRIAFPVEIALYQRLITEWGYDKEMLGALRRWMVQYERLEEDDVVSLFAEYGAALAPDDPEFMATLLFHRPPWDPRQFEAAVERLGRLSPQHASELAERFARAGDPAHARAVVQALRD